MFFLSFFVSYNNFLIIATLKQEIKEKTELINPLYIFVLMSEKILTSIKIVKKTVKILSQ